MRKKGDGNKKLEVEENCPRKVAMIQRMTTLICHVVMMMMMMIA